ncbi:hypothetical protein AFLA_001642 [Aspergillus flavus NRRL3357]|nr:hypothetical protein AFLA_001642 [Aspergillus flavus NRRL3357]
MDTDNDILVVNYHPLDRRFVHPFILYIKWSTTKVPQKQECESLSNYGGQALIYPLYPEGMRKISRQG